MEPITSLNYGNNTVFVYESTGDLKAAAIDHIAQYAVDVVAQKSIFSMALSGGSTPVGIYKGLVGKKWFTTFPWQQSHFLFGDERYVPHDHEQSNYKMAMEAFLEAAPVSNDHIYPVPTDCEHPDDCAEIYERQLKEGLKGQQQADGLPVIDLVLLGMGDDGHTASLFPDTDILNESESAVAAVYVDKLDSWRISMTFPLLNMARQVMVLVSGEAKSSVLADVLRSQQIKYPIQMLDNPNGMLWFVDQAAASQLQQR